MIVILDTNALHGDVFAENSWAQTLFKAAEIREDLEIRVPSVVVEELVRQFPERFDEIAKAFKAHRHTVNAYGFELPQLPDRDQEVSAYRPRLEGNLQGPGRGIAPPPVSAGLIAEQVAQRRTPIPGDGSGTVDAQIWRTAVEAAQEDGEVVLITNNHDDFADETDKTKLHPVLQQDLIEAQCDEDSVKLLTRILDFNQEHIEPEEAATIAAQNFLSNTSERAVLAAALQDASEWFSLDLEEEEWFARTDIDSAHVAVFDVEAIRLVRADEGSYATVEAYGEATIEIWLPKGEAFTLSDSSIEIDDYDFNESMATGRALVPARMLAEVSLSTDEDLVVAVEELKPVTDDEVLSLLKTWVDAHPERALAIAADSFDVPGEQEVRAARLSGLKMFAFFGDVLYVRAVLNLDYANPVDEDDHDLSAQNVAEHVVDLKVTRPDLTRLELESVEIAMPSIFPS